jgi:predicted PurR-regulated permease PerM
VLVGHRPMAPNPTGARPAGKSRLASLGVASLVILVIAGIGVLLYISRAAFVPVAFSLLFALVLSSPVELLYRAGVPRTLGAILILMVFIGIVGVTLNVIWAPARAWVHKPSRSWNISWAQLRPRWSG